ncbi:hypothetical protein QTV49_001743 [Vibrio vulnificus]|nr:hypothetical protein [Vibrio vulnificus]
MNKEIIYQTLKGKERCLFATHDLSFTNFCKSLDKGSLSWPSLALQEVKAINEDKTHTGYAGSSLFGKIRLVVKGDALTEPNTYRLSDNVTIFDSNFCSAIIPSVQFQVNEDALLDLLTEKIGDHPFLDQLMESFMDSVSEEAFDFPLVFADFHSEVVRTHVFKFLFSRDIAKDSVCDFRDEAELFRALEDMHYQYSDPRYDHFISEILEASSLAKGVHLGGNYIEIDEHTSESEIIEAFYEMYPISEVGALLRQANSGDYVGFSDEMTSIDSTVLAAMFTKRIASLTELDDGRQTLINTSGITPYCDRNHFTSSIHVLQNELAKNPPKIINKAMELVFRELNASGSVGSEKILELFSEAGVIVDDGIQSAVERCVKYKSHGLQPFFEMKIEGEFSLENVSHIVVPEVIREDIEVLLSNAGLDLPVIAYRGKTISELEWGRVMATMTPDINKYLLLDRDGLTPALKLASSANNLGKTPFPLM